MLSPHNALAGALHAGAGPRLAPRRALVLGGAGALGAAVLEQLLSSHRFERVGVLARTSLQPALRGLHVVADDAAALTAFAAETALIVFDRERHANGRDAAFARALPGDLPHHARALLQAGARSLIVVVPHAPALLPQALKLGLANMDEGAVAALGFTQLVFMRMAQEGAPAAAGDLSPPQRLAAWMLSQLRWMVPQREQAVRMDTVARVAAALAVALPTASAGTRVLPPELLWLAAQGAQPPADLLAAWLSGKPVSQDP